MDRGAAVFCPGRPVLRRIMLKIAFVEDQTEETERMREYCARFSEESGQEIALDVFANGLQFLSAYDPAYRLVFFDIEMPILNGLEAAKALYEMDKNSAIVFYTNMAKYAIKGYEVGALDFLVKPVAYSTFRAKMKKWLPVLLSREQKELVLNVVGGGLIKLSVAEVRYIESDKHYLIYHTSQGDFETRGTMAEAEQALREDGFSRSTRGCLANLACVTKVERDTVYLRGGVALPLARMRKKEFMEDFMNFFRLRG